jgi:hypothetical protein
MKKLDKLNFAGGSVLPPSTPVARLQPFTLSITRLSLNFVTIPSPLDPSSLPLVRSLDLCLQACQPIRLLLPQLALLQVAAAKSAADVGMLVQQSTSVTSFSIRESRIVDLDDASKTVIQERIIEFRLLFTSWKSTNGSTLASMIDGSRAMKKVTLDGVNLLVGEQMGPKFLETLKVVKEACKKKKIELWKENFYVGNGKVDLEI